MKPNKLKVHLCVCVYEMYVPAGLELASQKTLGHVNLRWHD